MCVNDHFSSTSGKLDPDAEGIHVEDSANGRASAGRGSLGHGVIIDAVARRPDVGESKSIGGSRVVVPEDAGRNLDAESASAAQVWDNCAPGICSKMSSENECKTNARVSGMIQATDNQISTSAAAAADERYRSESAKIGSAAYCDKLRAMYDPFNGFDQFRLRLRHLNLRTSLLFYPVERRQKPYVTGSSRRLSVIPT